MRKYPVTLIIITIFIIRLQPAPIFANDNVGAEALKLKLNNVVKVMESLNQKNDAELLSPGFYKKFLKATRKTGSLIENGGKLKKINISLDKVNILLEKIKKNITQGKLTFGDLLKKRDFLVNKFNSKAFLEMLKEADNEIKDGGYEIEDGDLKGAKKQIENISNALYNGEVAGSKDYFLRQIKKIEETINRSKAKRLMKKNFKEITQCKSDLEKYIIDKPGDDNTIENMMNLCREKWNIFKARLVFHKQVKKDGWNMEDMIIFMDTKLDQLLAANGKEVDASTIISEKVKSLKNYLEEDQNNISDFSKKNKYMSETLKKKDKELSNLNSLFQIRKKIAENYKKLKEIYNNKVSLIKIENNDIVIDLYGLTFKPGGFDVTSNAFPLLEKIKKSIELFNNYDIEIIGHTDSLGNPKSNKILSRQRANTVSTYLLSTGVLSRSQLDVIGAGDDKPLKPNTTPSNRKKNRRVEIRIKNVVSLN